MQFYGALPFAAMRESEASALEISGLLEDGLRAKRPGIRPGIRIYCEITRIKVLIYAARS